MVSVRTILGTGAAALIAVGLNFLVLYEDLFTAVAYLPLGAGLVCGIVWAVLLLIGKYGPAGRASLSGMNTTISSIAFLGICVTAYAFVLRWDTTVDLTREGRRALSPQTIQVLEGLKDDVEVICLFVFAGDQRLYNAQEKTRRFLALCQQYTNRLKIEFVDPQRDPVKVETLRKSTRAGAKLGSVSGVGTIVLKSGTNQREIPLSDVTSRLEERDFANALINVARKSRPKVYFLTGHGEQDILDTAAETGSSTFKIWLEKEAYQTDRLFISYPNGSIPEDCDVIIINGWSSDFHVHEIQVLDEYVARGGRILVLSNPLIVLNPGQNTIEQFRPWLERTFGVQLGTDFVVSRVTDGPETMLIPDFNDERLGTYADGPPEPGRDFRGSFNNAHPITRGMDLAMVFKRLRSVRLAEKMPGEARGVVLLRTTPDTFAETDLETLTKERRAHSDPEDPEGPIPVAVAVSKRSGVPIADTGRFKDARIVVAGNSDMTTNQGIASLSNVNFVLNALAWLTESEELIAIRATGHEDPPLLLSQRERQAVAWITSLGTVQAIAIAGAAVLLYRRRYQ